MKIEGWDKINGFTYKGYAITKAGYDTNFNLYCASIINLNDSNILSWYLSLLPDENNLVHLLKIVEHPTIPNGTTVQKGVTTDTLKTLRMFRVHYEGLIEEMILLTTKHKSNVVGATTGPSQGIINQVQTAGTNFVYAKSRRSGSSFIQANLIQALKDLEEQIQQYKQYV